MNRIQQSSPFLPSCMNWLHFYRQLEEYVNQPKLKTSSGQVFISTDPYDLYLAVLRAADSDEKRSEIESRFGQYGAFDALESWSLSCPPLIRFEWDSSTSPCYCTLRLFDVGDRVSYIYVCLQMSQQRDRVIAALEPKSSQSLYVEFFRDLFTDNGKGYHVELWHRLPDRTENNRPDLLARDVISECYAKWFENDLMPDHEKSQPLSKEVKLRKLNDYLAASYREKTLGGTAARISPVEIVVFFGAMILLMLVGLEKSGFSQMKFDFPVWVRISIVIIIAIVTALAGLLGKEFRDFVGYIVRRVRVR